MPVATVSTGVGIFYEPFGDTADPVLLLMHGLGSQLLLWEEGFCNALAAKGFQVVRYDHRDSGLSTTIPDAPVGGAAYTLSDMAADAAGLLDNLGAPDAHVVGLSLGAMVAQVFAAEHPGRSRSLVSMSSNTGHPDYGQPTGAALEALLVPTPNDPEKRAAKDLADRRIWASPEWHDDEHCLAVFADYAARSRQPASAQGRQFAAIAATGNREPLLAALTVPTLILHGTADTLVPPTGGERTAEVIPGAELVLVDGWGHDLPPGSWPRLVELISTHAGRVDCERQRASG
ncbi:MAG: alpha/beta fold hydrolase [Actinomycetota bacterium]|nr:alpha/beta fold hydrolase [Actinomycetota bacterium]